MRGSMRTEPIVAMVTRVAPFRFAARRQGSADDAAMREADLPSCFEETGIEAEVVLPEGGGGSLFSFLAGVAMIVHRNAECIESWSYGLPCLGPPPKDANEALKLCADQLPEVLAVLERARLLMPSQLVVHLIRNRPDRLPDQLVYPIEKSVDVEVAIRRAASDCHAALWHSFEVVGSGVVCLPKGDRPFPDVVGIRCLLFHSFTSLSVATWCDAWLQRDLRGRSQLDVCELNAPRLRGALEGVERVVGAVGSCDSYSRFATCDGYDLSARGDDEDPADFDDLGIDETWIAAE
jgi:hypothetical protein